MKSKKPIITIVLCIALVLSFTLLTSYAYWKISKTQTGTNVIEGACLHIELEEEVDENNNPIGGFTLENAWPKSQLEVLDQEGYNFTIVNTCEKPVTYQLILDSLEVSEPEKRINPDYISIYLEISKNDDPEHNYSYNRYFINDVYSSFKDVDTDDLDYNPIASKQLYVGIIPGKNGDQNGSKTFNLKLWINEDAPNSEMGKEFNSKVRAIAGQEIEFAVTPESCFDFDSETGTIIGYHEDECTTDYLVVPSTINGTVVKKISFDDCYPNPNSDCDISWEYLDLTKATGLEIIDDDVFSNYGGYDRKLVIPDGVKTIGAASFALFNGSNLVLGSGLHDIKSNAFWNYRGIGGNLIIPEGVENVEVGAFESLGLGLTYRVKVSLPSTIKLLGYTSFGYLNPIITINMSEEDFNNVTTKDNYWTGSDSEIIYLKQ